MTIVDFILARYAELEQAARKAKPGPWTLDGGSIYATHPTDEVVDWVYDESWEHIALNDPAYVLEDLAAKRFVLDTLRQHEPSDEWGTEPDMGRRSNNAAGAVRRMAQPFASHPDYDPAWRPS